MKIKPLETCLYFLPVTTRIPLKFGTETLTSATCARVYMKVINKNGKIACGWGETPLSVQWAWPADLSYEYRHEVMKDFCKMLAEEWTNFKEQGHAIELGSTFINDALPGLLKKINYNKNQNQQMPWLAALICCSAFDIALHDAYGNLLEKYIYETYTSELMSKDLSFYLTPAEGSNVSFANNYPSDYLNFPRSNMLAAWHLVGGKDLIDEEELTGSEPNDGYPVLLTDWIKRDCLKCLKVKLRGNDTEWDYERLVRVGTIAIKNDVLWLTTDFNCTVRDPDYVNDILDKLKSDHPRIYQMILYIEQPFPYDLEKNQIDVHSVSSRKPLFMDESAHDWQLIKLGRQLGWTGVALKTCKTQTGALLSLCWAKAHGMTLMVQDLTNPMLAQIPHCLLAAHAGTIMGVETNSMQFYPAASQPEENVHRGLYKRRNGKVDLSTISGSGFGYRIDEIKRNLPEKACCY